MLFCCILLAGCSRNVSPREIVDFNDGWSFRLETDEGERMVNLPHDWAVEGDFSIENPSGPGGGALPGGIGWYRKIFVAPENEAGRLWRIEFDGVYMNSEVFINGHSLGVRPYGYISFGYDITPFLKWGEENEIKVRVDNSQQPNSRWYSGCGIYRDVRLTKTSEVRVAPNGTFVIADINEAQDVAKITVRTTIANAETEKADIRVVSTVLSASSKAVVSSESSAVIPAQGEKVVEQSLSLNKPSLWDIDNPYMYTLKTEIWQDGQLKDRYQTPFGVRSFEFDASKGFILNGKQVKINGVCLHHDFGCLGSAFNVNAARRQLDILKSMGCNGIRTSHNPPAPQLLDLCDEMGFIVQDEAFDMWRKRKTAYDYSKYFNEWHERDLTDFITRDRNHPSIFMWSIGNEVLEQWSHADADTLSLAEANLVLNFGHSSDMLANSEGQTSVNSLLTAKLSGIVHSLDPTRPVTSGCNEPSPYNHLFRSGALDIIGFNYHNSDVLKVPENFPGMPFIITESNSALMTRGYYRMPSDHMYIWPERWDIPFFDDSYACSSYENCHVPWGNTHEENIRLVRDNDYISGQYIWTGFDYIGEPTPYGWPARSSYFGIIDLAGFPKDVYYLYRSEWTDEQVLHLFPHWNWEEGQEIDMWCYYNHFDEVELFVNGVSQGRKHKTEDQLHVVWRVRYEAGTVEVAGRRDGKECARKAIHTAGEPARIRLTMDKYGEGAIDDALGFITVEILDADGNLCPDADNLVDFHLQGDSAFIAGTDNGNPVSMERFKDDRRHAFYGKCLVVLQAAKPGDTILTATSEGLESAEIIFTTK